MIPEIPPSRIPPEISGPKKKEVSSKQLFSLPKEASQGAKNPKAFQETLFSELTRGLDLKPKEHHLGALSMNFSDDRSHLEEFANLVVDDLREDYRKDLEPFEAYAEKVRERIYRNAENLEKRFVEGFRVLTDALEKKGPQNLSH